MRRNTKIKLFGGDQEGNQFEHYVEDLGLHISVKKTFIPFFFEYLLLPRFKISISNSKKTLRGIAILVEIAEHYDPSTINTLADDKFRKVGEVVTGNIKTQYEKHFNFRIPTKYIRPAYYAVRFSVLDIYSEAPAFKVKLIARYYWSEIIKVHDFSNYISLLAIIISMLAIILPFIIRN